MWMTIQGWVMAIAVAIVLMFLAIIYIHPFLAVTSRIKADALVVEGWISDEALKQAVAEINISSYRLIFTTGGPVDRGSYLAEYKNFAEIAAATLKKLDVQEEKLVVVPTPRVERDRTHASAVTFRQLLTDSNYQLESINLFTNDAHARRSWLIFKQVLAPQIKVGIITAKTQGYNPKKWWVSSAGVRTIISETIAYIYAVFMRYS